MAKNKPKPPPWWLQHKEKIRKHREKLTQEARARYEKKYPVGVDQKNTWQAFQWNQNRIEQFRLLQNTRSESELMRLQDNRTEMILTFTIASPYRVGDTDKSFDAVMQRIVTQAKSLMYYIRTISKSTKFNSNECKECAYKKRLHYHWTLELQSDGNVHMHIVISIYDDVRELLRLIELVHSMRNTHLYSKVIKSEEIFPLGRTHFALSAHHKKGLLAYWKAKAINVVEWEDKNNSSRKNYFLPSLSPNIDIYSGAGTLLEFNDNETMAGKYDALRKYVISMTKAKFKLRTVQAAASSELRVHNLKGKFANEEERAATDIAVFEFLGLKLHASSQMLFSKSLYQKIRTKLIVFNPRYKSLAAVTVDWCKGDLVIEGKEPNRKIYYRGQLITIEPKKQKVNHVDVTGENINEYLLAKEGV